MAPPPAQGLGRVATDGERAAAEVEDLAAWPTRCSTISTCSVAPDPLQQGSAMPSSENRISAVLEKNLTPIASYRSAANSVGV